MRLTLDQLEAGRLNALTTMTAKALRNIASRGASSIANGAK